MLRAIYDLIDEADAIVHYNGIKFDLPTLNQEFMGLGLTPPAPYKQIDLLSVARKQFRLPSNKLDYVAQHFGLGRKTPHKGMELWKGCMDGNPASWTTMKRYNIQDVRLLERVYELFLPWIANHPNIALYVDATHPVCTNCGGKHLQSRGTSYTRTATYQRFQCQSCGAWMRGRKNTLEKEKKDSLLS